MQKRFAPRYVIPNHLVDCEWTVVPSTFKSKVEARGLANIIVTENRQETFEIT